MQYEEKSNCEHCALPNSATVSEEPVQSKSLDRSHAHDPAMSRQTSLAPLFIILAYISGGVLLRAVLSDDFDFHRMMADFMGGFFVVFSLFKMIDREGFADAYATYDVIAARSRNYALAYPFIELALGIAYLSGTAPLLVNSITVLLMAIGSVGVFRSLLAKQEIHCACLGTALKLPMTKVTLLEDVLMGLMALAMIFS